MISSLTYVGKIGLAKACHISGLVVFFFLPSRSCPIKKFSNKNSVLYHVPERNELQLHLVCRLLFLRDSHNFRKYS